MSINTQHFDLKVRKMRNLDNVYVWEPPPPCYEQSRCAKRTATPLHSFDLRKRPYTYIHIEIQNTKVTTIYITTYIIFRFEYLCLKWRIYIFLTVRILGRTIKYLEHRDLRVYKAPQAHGVRWLYNQIPCRGS